MVNLTRKLTLVKSERAMKAVFVPTILVLIQQTLLIQYFRVFCFSFVETCVHILNMQPASGCSLFSNCFRIGKIALAQK